jgi:acetyl esterase/lipase
MKKEITLTLLIGFLCIQAYSQEVIRLYKGKAPGSENWTWHEQEKYYEMFKSKIVYNVADPTLTIFRPDKSIANGTAVIICPGGAFHTLSIGSEGYDVAKWLNSRGVTAFVLKYRVVKSETDDPGAEVFKLMGNSKKLDSINAPVVPLAFQDGLTSIKYVREHAEEFGLDKHKIGLMGFSAGGTLTLGATLISTPESRPDFIAPIYPYTGVVNIADIPKNSPPAFIAAATDDQLGFAPSIATLYINWIASGNVAELHMYSKGGHGFGMRVQNLPVDKWYEGFGDWLTLLGFIAKK